MWTDHKRSDAASNCWPFRLVLALAQEDLGVYEDRQDRRRLSVASSLAEEMIVPARHIRVLGMIAPHFGTQSLQVNQVCMSEAYR